MGRKKLIVEILRCERCDLIFRYPTEEVAENEVRYQEIYDAPIVTRLPGDADLAGFLQQGFPGNLDFSARIAAMCTLCSSGRILDYGCSWGYGVHQLRAAGFDAVGYEVSRPRARFGTQKLGVGIIDTASDLAALPPGSFDAIFSNHAIEHLPDLNAAFDTFARLLAPGGLLFSILPNFTGRSAREGLFWRWIGCDHPIAPTDRFFERSLMAHGFATVKFGSSPFDNTIIERLRAREFDRIDRDGDELLVMAWMPRLSGSDQPVDD